MIKLKEYLSFSIIVVLFFLLLIFSNQSYVAAKNGLELFMNNVFPSIFPFLIIINFLMNCKITYVLCNIVNPITKWIFKLPGVSSLPIIFGFLTGYPVGAKISSDLYEKGYISKSHAETLLSFTNNASPLFIISYIGISLFHDTRTGILLLITHIIAATIVGIILGRKKDNQRSHLLLDNTPEITISENIIYSIKNSIKTILLIGGFIIFFSVIIELLNDSHFFYILSIPLTYIFNLFDIPTATIIPILQGMIEMTNGLYNISDIESLPYIYKVCASSFILGLGGLSIYMHTLSVIINSNLSTKKYIISKILQGGIACTLTYILIKYTPFFNLEVIETYSKPYTELSTVITMEESNIIFNVIAVAIMFCAFFKIYQIKKEK